MGGANHPINPWSPCGGRSQGNHRVLGFEFGGLGFRVSGFGLRVWGSGFRV